MAVDRSLSPTQQAFLKVLFTTASGNLKKASLEVIGTEDYSSLMTEELTQAIKKRADTELAMSVPKAVLLMQQMMESPESVFIFDKLHKVCADILDRAGISKQERPSQSSMTIGIVMLPMKASLPEPPTIEQIERFEGPILNLLPSAIKQ